MRMPLVFLGVFLCALQGLALDGAKLVSDAPVYDFGRVDQSAVITNVFQLRNEGQRTFVLKYLRPSCSCTRARIDKRMIAPGDGAEVTAVFTAARQRGPQRRAIRLVAADPHEVALTFYLEGFVEPSAGSD